MDQATPARWPVSGHRRQPGRGSPGGAPALCALERCQGGARRQGRRLARRPRRPGPALRPPSGRCLVRPDEGASVEDQGEEDRSRPLRRTETLTLAPLPCWKHLSPEIYRARIKGIIQQIDADAAAQREASGHKPLGADAILRQDPRTEPNRTKKSPAPRFHAVRKWVRKELYQTYTLFVQAYREAAELLRMGNRNAVFPRGCFPPPLPFVDRSAVPLSRRLSPSDAFVTRETPAHYG